MKDILKAGNVRVWFIGEQAMVETTLDATVEELEAAMDAEEELERWRMVAEWN
jgi:hypothetical protein